MQEYTDEQMTAIIEFCAAAKACEAYLGMSTDIFSSDCLYRPPSTGLREAADRIDRKDAVVMRYRKALDRLRDVGVLL